MRRRSPPVTVAPEDTLNYLLAALKAFSFGGRVAVEHTMKVGTVERYEVNV